MDDTGRLISNFYKYVLSNLGLSVVGIQTLCVSSILGPARRVLNTALVVSRCFCSVSGMQRTRSDPGVP